MSTSILIIEDEELAAKRLERLLKDQMSDSQIVGFCDSIQSAIRFLQNNPHPDLIMLDIQLGDGLCFEIFKQVKVNCPVIFTTAYDEYAIKAFDLNSIDYLLKPINIDALRKSIAKFELLRRQPVSLDIQTLLPLLNPENKSYKKRFVIAVSDRLVPVNTIDIAYFCSIDKSSYIVDYKGVYYAIEQSLDKLEEILDPKDFFRVNRQFIVSATAIDKILLLSKSKIKLHLKPTTKEEIFVSNNRAHEFRTWLDK